MANDPIQIKRGSSADLPTLSQAEFAITTDNDELFIGNGSENIEVVTEGASIRILSDFQDTDYDDGQVPTWNDADSRFEPGEGSSGGGLTWQIISSDTTASKDNGYLIDASEGDVTLTLPDSPSEGDMVGVCDYTDSATTNTITIGRNGEKIEGDDSDLTIDIDGSGMTLVYTDPGRGWDIVSEIGGGDYTSERLDTNEARIIMNAFEEARNNSISVHGMIQGRVDEYEDEDGIDTAASSGQTYDSDGYYSNVAHDVPFDKVKGLKVTSADGSPTISHALKVELVSGDETTTDTGNVPVDWTNISDPSDIALYDTDDNLMDYYIEYFDESEEKAVLHTYADWVRDDTIQAKVAYGNGPSDQSVSASTVFDKEAGLKAAYLFNETSGDLIDVSGNNNDGTVYGATQGEHGVVGGAYDFDRDEDEYVEIPRQELSYPVTLEATIKPSSFQDYPLIVGTEDSSNYSGLNLQLDDGGQIEAAIGDGSGSGGDNRKSFVSDTALEVDTDYHIAAVFYDIDDVKVYINGDEDDVSVSGDATSLGYNNAPASIGKREAGGPYYIDSLIDDIRVYSLDLSPDEITSKNDAIQNSPDFFEHQAAEGTGAQDMTLISTDYTAETEPNTGRLILREEDIDTVTLNTDLLAYLSKDGGSTWDELTLEELDVFDDIRILEGEVGLSSSGTDMAYKIETANDKLLRIHAASDTWD